MLDPEWLKITRIRLGLTMQDIAEKMFVTKQCISDIERGKTHRKVTMTAYENVLKEYLKDHPLRDIF